MAEELRLEDALQAVDVEWSNDRSATALAGMHKKRRRRTATRVGVAVAAVAMLAGGSYRALRGGADTGAESRTIADKTQPAPAPTRSSRAVVLADGSTITPAADAEPVEVVEDTAGASRVRLRNGKSTFKVATADKGTLRVVSGNVRIAVYSAEFSASGTSESVEVWVETGHLEVTWSGGTKRVEAGEHATFDTGAADSSASSSDTGDDSSAVAAKPDKPKTAKRRKAADGTWRVLARAGKYREAFEALEKTGNRAVRDQIGDLMLAADVARISGHPRQALKPLRRVIAKFPRDPRAPLAAFTQGRILLDKLGRASSAARAFAKARALAPRGALAEDALAREVESWSRAGNKAKAGERARLYLKRYPNGHRARAMKNYAGL